MPDAPAAPIALIVSGEGSHQLASIILRDYEVYDWKSPPSADSMAGRQVQLWGSTPEAVAKLAPRYLKTAATVAIIETTEDFSTVLGERGSGDAVVDYIKARLHPIAPLAKIGRPRSGVAPVSQQGDSAVVSWHSMGLECNSSGAPQPSIPNVKAILLTHPRFSNRVWFDDFRGEIMYDQNGISRAWTDADDLHLVDFIVNVLKISKFGLQTIMHGVQLAGFINRRNSVTTWLDSLVWDGTERLSSWLSDFLGAQNTAYEQAAGRNWLISMVARAYRPGCQADHMPVLEGASGRGKSSALRILGGEWYCAAPQAFGSKEFLEAIQGAWLIEIPDMVGFGRREHSQIISAITTVSDSYRASYGRHSEDHPRTCIFVATSETDDYLQDSRGIRRYWPVRCTETNLEGLSAARSQLFAEAVAAFKSGASWHEMPTLETTEEQSKRQELDAWTDQVAGWIGNQTDVVVMDVAVQCLFIEPNKVDRSTQMRISKILKLLGFKCEVAWTANRPVRKYRRTL